MKNINSQKAIHILERVLHLNLYQYASIYNFILFFITSTTPRYSNQIEGSNPPLSISIPLANQSSYLNQTWRQSGMVILFYIRHAVVKLMSLSSQIKLRNLQQRHFRMIGDQSISYQFYQQNGFLRHKSGVGQDIFQILKKLTDQFKIKLKIKISTQLILYPDSKKKIFLDMVLMITFFILIIIMPIRVAFMHEFQFEEPKQRFLSSLYYYTGLFVMTIQIVTSSITGYYKKGQLIVRKREIFKYYYKGGALIFDVITLILFLMAHFLEIVYFQIPILYQIIKISQILRQIEENFQFQEKVLALINLSQLALQILIIAHICGCTFYLFHEVEMNYNSDTTWIKSIGLTHSGWSEKYIASLYWSVVTMVTLGYGDIVPVTQEERIFVIFFTLFSSGLFGYTINHIGNVLQKLEEQNKDKIREISLISTYLRQRNLGHDLLMKSRRYLQYLADANDKSEQCELILNKLGNDLQVQIRRDIYRQIILQHKFFSLNFSLDCLTEFSDIMNEKKFGPDDVVVEQQQLNDKIYFVMRGQLSIKKKVTEITQLSKGMIFGKESFLTSQPEQTSVICQNVVTVAYIQRDDFLSILKKYPAGYEKFCDMRDNLMINSNTDGLDLRCMACDSFQHEISLCPLVSFVPNKDKELFSDNTTVEQVRRASPRREYRNTNPLGYIDYLHDAAIDVLIATQYYLDYEEERQMISRIETIRERDKDVSRKQKYELLNIFSDNQQIEQGDDCDDWIIEEEGEIQKFQNLSSLKKPTLVPQRNQRVGSVTFVDEESDQLQNSDFNGNSKKNYLRVDSKDENAKEQNNDCQDLLMTPLRNNQRVNSKTFAESRKAQWNRNQERELTQRKGGSLIKTDIQSDDELRFSNEIQVNDAHSEKKGSSMMISSENYQYPTANKNIIPAKPHVESEEKHLAVSIMSKKSSDYRSESHLLLQENDSMSEKSVNDQKQRNFRQNLQIRESFSIDSLKIWPNYKKYSNLDIVLKIKDIEKGFNQITHPIFFFINKKSQQFINNRIKTAKIQQILDSRDQPSGKPSDQANCDDDIAPQRFQDGQESFGEKKIRIQKNQKFPQNPQGISVFSRSQSQGNDELKPIIISNMRKQSKSQNANQSSKDVNAISDDHLLNSVPLSERKLFLVDQQDSPSGDIKLDLKFNSEQFNSLQFKE